MKNIILIGMPAAGKSTIGVLLAKTCVMDFLDTDLLLQKAAGVSLETLIEREGEDAFLTRESTLLASLTVENTVVATGGSAVYSDIGMRHLATIGTILYLKISPQEVAERVGNLHRRGVILHGNTDLASLYRERESLYQRYTDLTVDLSGLETAEALATVHRVLDQSEKE